jgi:anti-anti-sigma factor
MSDADTFVTSYMVDDDILVLMLHGRFDDKTAAEFDAEIEKRFAEGAHKIIIDCSLLGYVSSYGIGKLISLQGKLRMKGGEVKLSALQSMVADVFRIVHLDRLFEIYGDIEFARESFYE